MNANYSVKQAANIIFAFVSSLIFAILNMRGLVDGPRPAISNFVLSLVFILIYFLYGMFITKLKDKRFLITVIIFWVFGLIISFICINLKTTPLWIISFLFLAPLNGLRHLDFLNTTGLLFALINTLTPILAAYIGYSLTSKIAKSSTS